VKFLRLFLVPFAGLAVIFIRLVRPWWHIRFGTLISNRIGHLAGNSEVYLCERDHGMHKATDIWIPLQGVANPYLLKMLKRVMNIDTSGFGRIVQLIDRLFDGWEPHVIPNTSMDRDVLNLMEKYPAHLKFTEKEEKRGREQLRKWGLPANAKWVCLIVRDAAYLPQLGYHSYRDCDVDTYKQAMLELASRGYYVFRMGVKVAKPFDVEHPFIIDFSERYSDFMSIYLGAKCEFCVSSGCGFDAIPYIFRRPICYTNYVPLEYLLSFAPNSLAIWKHHYKDGKRMTLEEIYKSKAGLFMSADQFKEAGITLQDNNPEEIRDVVVEMIDPAPPYSQTWFWDHFPRSISEYTQGPLHGQIRMRIGTKFLEQYIPNEPAQIDSSPRYKRA
jgi:putative glycosyltransferase (TIGR04372 family)